MGKTHNMMALTYTVSRLQQENNRLRTEYAEVAEWGEFRFVESRQLSTCPRETKETP
jgi:hypothetical protein